MILGINERFASIRKKYGLNVKEFAESLDMEPTTVSSIESGKREPSKEVLLNLAVKYACSLNWIFTGEGEESLPKTLRPEQNKHPILENIEKLIDERTTNYKQAIFNLETRLTALEKRLEATPDIEYPATEV
jgi:transcriptional regulator with XRE-family HTH domain